MTHPQHTGDPHADATAIRAYWAAHKREVAAAGSICAWLGVASRDPSDVAGDYSIQDLENRRG